jgi:hypothetical protein
MNLVSIHAIKLKERIEHFNVVSDIKKEKSTGNPANK